MVETMARTRSPEEVQRLKRLGVFDVGRSYLRLGGFARLPTYKPWDDDDEDPER